MMDKSTRSQDCVMAEVLKCGLMVRTMKAIGKTTSPMDVGACSTLPGMSTKGSGKMTERMARANSFSMVGRPTQGTGIMIGSMARAGKSGQMEMSMKDNTLMG